MLTSTTASTTRTLCPRHNAGTRTAATIWRRRHEPQQRRMGPAGRRALQPDRRTRTAHLLQAGCSLDRLAEYADAHLRQRARCGLDRAVVDRDTRLPPSRAVAWHHPVERPNQGACRRDDPLLGVRSRDRSTLPLAPARGGRSAGTVRPWRSRILPALQNRWAE